MSCKFLLSVFSFLLVSKISEVAAQDSYYYLDAQLDGHQVNQGDREYFVGSRMSFTGSLQNAGNMTFLGSDLQPASFFGNGYIDNSGSISIVSNGVLNFDGILFANTGTISLQVKNGYFYLRAKSFKNEGLIEIAAGAGSYIASFGDQLINDGTIILDNTSMQQQNFIGNGCIVVTNKAMYSFVGLTNYNQKHRFYGHLSGRLYFPATQLTVSLSVEGFTQGNDLVFEAPTESHDDDGGVEAEKRKEASAAPQFSRSYDTNTGILKVNLPLGGTYLISIGMGYSEDSFLDVFTAPRYQTVQCLRTDYDQYSDQCQMVNYSPLPLPVVSSTRKESGIQTKTTTTMLGKGGPDTVLELDPYTTHTTTSFWDSTYTSTTTISGTAATDEVDVVVLEPSSISASPTSFPAEDIPLASSASNSPTSSVSLTLVSIDSTSKAALFNGTSASPTSLDSVTSADAEANLTSAQSKSMSSISSAAVLVSVTLIESASYSSVSGSLPFVTESISNSVTLSSESVEVISDSVTLSPESLSSSSSSPSETGFVSTGITRSTNPAVTLTSSNDGAPGVQISSGLTQSPALAVTDSFGSIPLASQNTFMSGFFNQSLTEVTATSSIKGATQTYAPAPLEDAGNIDILTHILAADEITKMNVAYKGDLFSYSIQLEFEGQISANSYARFALPGPFTGYDAEFSLVDNDSNVFATVTADTDANIFTIKFDNNWAAQNFALHGTFVIYGFMSYTSGVLRKRDSKSIDLSSPVSIVLTANSGPGKLFPFTFDFNDVTTIHSSTLPQVSMFFTNNQNSVSRSNGASKTTISGATSISGMPTSLPFSFTAVSSGLSLRSSGFFGASRSTGFSSASSVSNLSSSSRFPGSTKSSRSFGSSSSFTVPIITTTVRSATTTLMTITDCGAQKCSMVIPVITNYVTYCPIGTIVTVTSCSINGCAPCPISLPSGTNTITGCFAVATPIAGLAPTGISAPANNGNQGFYTPYSSPAPSTATLVQAPKASSSLGANSGVPNNIPPVANLAAKVMSSFAILVGSLVLLF